MNGSGRGLSDEILQVILSSPLFDISMINSITGVLG